MRIECDRIIFLSSAPASDPIKTNSANPPGGAEKIAVTLSHFAIFLKYRYASNEIIIE